MFKRIRSESGFTLVELLVVLAILAILIAVVVPNLAGLTGGAQATACAQELDTVQTAVDTIIADNSAVTVTELTPAQTLSSDYVVTYVLWDDSTGTAALALRDTTTGGYTWDVTGKVTPATCPFVP